MSTPKTYDIFISYSRRDLNQVKSFVDMLHQRIPTLRIWMDLENIEAADEFDEKIIKAIDASSYVLFAMSSHSNSVEKGSSIWTKKELTYAKNTGKKVIPIILPGAELNSWFLFEFGRVDCIDILDNRQVEKLYKNLSKWTRHPLVDPASKVQPLPVQTDESSTTNKKTKRKFTKKDGIIIAVMALFGLMIGTTATIGLLLLYGTLGWIYYDQHYCTDFNYLITNHDSCWVTVVSAKENDKPNLKIPSRVKINGNKYTVREISAEAFEENNYIESVQLPKTLVKIGENAFAHCHNLRKIVIPQSVECIEKYAFEDCHNLEDFSYEGTYQEWSKVEVVDEELTSLLKQNM